MKLENLGNQVGEWLAPVASAATRWRGRRIFHPVGEVFRATVTAANEGKGAALGIAHRLGGTALVRLSGGLWREGIEHPDVLGCAIRFRWNGTAAEIMPGEQDVILATFRSLLTLPLALLTTRSGDFSRNLYHSAALYRVPGAGVGQFRLQPIGRCPNGDTRWEKLERWVNGQDAAFTLQFRREGLHAEWLDLVHIHLDEKLAINQEKLAFSPFHNGLGIQPVGIVNTVRRATYAASQAARQRQNRASQPPSVRGRSERAAAEA